MSILKEIKLLFGNNELLYKLTSDGIVALFVKLAAAGLTFLMFIFLARAMNVDDFGGFGYGFSLASFLAVVGGLGHKTLVLRFIPIYQHENKHALINGIIRYGYSGIFVCCFLIGIVLFGISYCILDMKNIIFIPAVILLTVTIGIAEYQTNVIRSFGQIALALIPRDVIWRLFVILVAVASIFGLISELTATSGLYFTGCILLLIILVQSFLCPLTQPKTLFYSPRVLDKKKWFRIGIGLWGTTLVKATTQYSYIIILGFFIGVEATAPYFAALRTSALLAIFSLAINIIVAPKIAKYYHSGDIEIVQKLCCYISLMIISPVILCFTIFIIYSEEIMLFYGEDFKDASELFAIMTIGYLATVLSGPNQLLMELTGHERSFLSILIKINIVMFLILPILIIIYNDKGAAICFSLSMVSSNVMLHYYCVKKIGVDPSIFSIRYLFK